MAKRHRELRGTRWLALVRRDPAYALEHGSQLRQLIERVVRLFRKVDALRGAEKALDKAVDLLPPNTGEVLEPVAGFCHLETCQAKRVLAILMQRQRIPQPHHERADELVGRIDGVEFRELATPERPDLVERRCCHERRSDVAEEPCTHLMERYRAGEPLKKPTDLRLAHTVWEFLLHHPPATISQQASATERQSLVTIINAG